MRIIPFKPEHLNKVSPQDAQSAVARYAASLDAQMLDRPGMAFTAVDGEHPVGCAGVVELWPGVGQAWAVLSEQALDHPVVLTRAAMRELPRICRDCGLGRVQASVADGHGAGARWLAFLGFEVEGLLLNYGPGGAGDYWMYGRTG